MFYSSLILSKKGPLADIWLAAHWEKKLKKAQIYNVNICDSVNAISHSEIPHGLRLSAHLLLGVVRIFSKKVNFLLSDCNDTLVKIRLSFRPGNVTLMGPSAKSITLPPPVDGEIAIEVARGDFIHAPVPANTSLMLADSTLFGDPDEELIHLRDQQHLARPREITLFHEEDLPPPTQEHDILMPTFTQELMLESQQSIEMPRGSSPLQAYPTPEVVRANSTVGVAPPRLSLGSSFAGPDVTTDFDPMLMDEYDDTPLPGEEGGATGSPDRLSVGSLMRSGRMSLGSDRDRLSLGSDRLSLGDLQPAFQVRKRKAVAIDTTTYMSSTIMRRHLKDSSPLVRDFVLAPINKYAMRQVERKHHGIELSYQKQPSFIEGLAPELLELFNTNMDDESKQMVFEEMTRPTKEKVREPEEEDENTIGNVSNYDDSTITNEEGKISLGDSEEPFEDDYHVPITDEHYQEYEVPLNDELVQEYEVPLNDELVELSDESERTAEEEEEAMLPPPSPTTTSRSLLPGSWNDRTKRMLQYLKKQIGSHDSMSYHEMVADKQLKTVVGSFFELLVLKSADFIEITQDTPYGDIAISKGELYNRPIPT